MKAFLKQIGLGIFTLTLVLACTNEGSIESGISKETVEIIANPHAISEADAIVLASHYVERFIANRETIDRLVVSTGMSAVETRAGNITGCSNVSWTVSRDNAF